MSLITSRSSLQDFGVPYDVDIPFSDDVLEIAQEFIGGWKDTPPDNGWDAVFSDCRRATAVAPEPPSSRS